MTNFNSSFKSTNSYRKIRNFERNLRKIIKRFFLTRKLNKATPIFVYQMGKVASSSIYHSLEKQYPGAVAFGHKINSNHWRGELMLDWVNNGNPLKIISPVREPIGRNISNFFELFEKYTGTSFSQSNYAIDELIQLYFKNYSHDLPLTWFDDNINKNFNIDIYKTPFPASGIATYSSENVSLLVFRIDISDSEKENAIRDFIGLPSFKLKNTNISSKKEYQDTYKEFTRAFSAPQSYLDKFEGSKYFNYFYSKDEIKNILSKWK